MLRPRLRVWLTKKIREGDIRDREIASKAERRDAMVSIIKTGIDRQSVDVENGAAQPLREVISVTSVSSMASKSGRKAIIISGGKHDVPIESMYLCRHGTRDLIRCYIGDCLIKVADKPSLSIITSLGLDRRVRLIQISVRIGKHLLHCLKRLG
jgi:hypothetical protein